MAKVKCKVLKRFNNNDPGAEIVAPSRAIFDSWAAYGFVEEIKEKEAKPPVDKMVRETVDK